MWLHNGQICFGKLAQYHPYLVDGTLAKRSASKGFRVDLVREIRGGANTEVFKKTMKSMLQYEKEDIGACCFSLVLDGRTVDIQASSRGVVQLRSTRPRC